MTAPRVLSLTLALSGAVGFGCSEKTPDKQMAAADDAAMAGKHQEALSLYESLLAWKGEGTVAAADRFKASLESVKCLVAVGRLREGVERFRTMYDEFKAEMGAKTAYRHMLAVLDSIAGARAERTDKNSQYLALLEVASVRHPEQKEQFGDWVDANMDTSEDSALAEELSKLGYLGGKKKKKTAEPAAEGTPAAPSAGGN
jgi:hypothetical protein